MTGARVVLSESTWQQPLPESAGPQRSAVVSSVADRIEALLPGRVLVAIDGRTASGKTSFGHELAHVVAGRGWTVLRASLDDFKRPWRERHLYDRESGEGYYRRAFDYDALERLLLRPFRERAEHGVALCAIDPITQIDHAGSRVTPPHDAVLVVDGVFALRPEIDAWWDLRVWLDVDGDVSLSRGLARDRGRVGDDAEPLHRDRYAVAEHVYLGEVDPVARADLVIDNRDLAHPSLVRDAARLPRAEGSG